MHKLKDVHHALLPDWYVTVHVSGDELTNRAQRGNARMETLASSQSVFFCSALNPSSSSQPGSQSFFFSSVFGFFFDDADGDDEDEDKDKDEDEEATKTTNSGVRMNPKDTCTDTLTYMHCMLVKVQRKPNTHA